jgi:hypothetical protein
MKREDQSSKTTRRINPPKQQGGVILQNSKED